MRCWLPTIEAVMNPPPDPGMLDAIKLAFTKTNDAIAAVNLETVRAYITTVKIKKIFMDKAGVQELQRQWIEPFLTHA